MFKQKSLILLAMIATAVISGEVLAHATYVQKDDYVTLDGRSYLEGRNSELSLNLSHSCGAGTGTVINPVIFPNGTDNEVYALKLIRNQTNHRTLDVSGEPAPSQEILSNVLTAAALTGIKPRVDRGDWGQIAIKKDGSLVRAIHWHEGWVPDDFYERNNFVATFAGFKPDSCVTKVRVYIPSIQYCTTTAGTFAGLDAWIWRPISGQTGNNAALSSSPHDLGRAAYIDIDRDLKNNKLSKKCGKGDDNQGETKGGWNGKVIGIYPIENDIKQYLIHSGEIAPGVTNWVCGSGSTATPANEPDHITHHGPWCSDGSDPIIAP
jgi:uncharacterized protein YcnI